jgi:hypothetical protein
LVPRNRPRCCSGSWSSGRTSTGAGAIEDWGAIMPHEAYATGLRTKHGRKRAFWELAV